MGIELKPCPFCGGEPVVLRRGTSIASMIISCPSCGGRMESGDVIGMTDPRRWRWNTRAVDGDNARLLEELEKGRRNYFDCREENTALHMLLEEKAQELAAAETKLARVVEAMVSVEEECLLMGMPFMGEKVRAAMSAIKDTTDAGQ